MASKIGSCCRVFRGGSTRHPPFLRGEVNIWQTPSPIITGMSTRTHLHPPNSLFTYPFPLSKMLTSSSELPEMPNFARFTSVSIGKRGVRVISSRRVDSSKTYKSFIAIHGINSDPMVPQDFALYREPEIFCNSNSAGRTDAIKTSSITAETLLLSHLPSSSSAICAGTWISSHLRFGSFNIV